MAKSRPAVQVGVHPRNPTIDADGRLSFWPEGFFDQHEENLARLLAPSH